ncbi:43651_t:CDS:2, partial [Gigaspora margarita]
VSISSAETLRQSYLKPVYEKHISMVKLEFVGKPIAIIADETTDDCAKSVVNILFNYQNVTKLVVVDFLNEINNVMVGQIILRTLHEMFEHCGGVSYASWSESTGANLWKLPTVDLHNSETTTNKIEMPSLFFGRFKESYRLNLNNKLLDVCETEKNSVEDVHEADRNLVEAKVNHDEEYIVY